jgi:hypothetical protein
MKSHAQFIEDSESADRARSFTEPRIWNVDPGQRDHVILSNARLRTYQQLLQLSEWLDGCSRLFKYDWHNHTAKSMRT